MRSKRRLLLVDDDEALLTYFMEMLAEQGYDPGDDELCQQVFNLAKHTNRTLTDLEIHDCCRQYGATRARVS